MPVRGLLKTLSRTFFCFRYGTTRAQAFDFTRVEAQLPENLVVVLADIWSALCSDFYDAMHFYRTANRRSQLAARTFEWKDDVVQPQLRIVDYLLRPAYRAERDVNAIEDLVPM